jgi:hypothetical protein
MAVKGKTLLAVGDYGRAGLEAFAGREVAIGDATAMRRIVLPDIPGELGAGALAANPHHAAEKANELPSPHIRTQAQGSCSHGSPEGGCRAVVGRHGATKPSGRTRGRNDMVGAR